MRVWDSVGEDGVSIAERRGDGKGAGGGHRPRRGLTRRPRRGKRACSPMGRSIASDGDPKGVQGGNEGKRVSSGYNRRRRLATRSSGKQQAGRTAVRTAPIVCPEESPLVRPQAHTPCSARRVRPEGGAGGRAESHPACSAERNLCRGSYPWQGPDAPTPRRGAGGERKAPCLHQWATTLP